MAKLINNLEELRQAQENYEYVLLKVFSPTCIPCKNLKVVLDELEGDYLNYITFMEMDGSQHRDWCISQGIRTVPHLILYDKTTSSSYSFPGYGSASKEKIKEFLGSIDNTEE